MSEAAQGPLWRAGEVIDGRYEVIRLAGEGGMGWVYQVRHLEWGIDLAVKQPKPEHLEGFEQEAEAWVKLGLHPNLCCCHYVRQLNGLPMVFAEYVPGGSLHDWIEDRRLYEGPDVDVLRRLLDVAVQFAWGLEHAYLRNAKLQLSAVLASAGEVPGLYLHPDHRRRLRREPVRSDLSV